MNARGAIVAVLGVVIVAVAIWRIHYYLTRSSPAASDPVVTIDASLPPAP